MNCGHILDIPESASCFSGISANVKCLKCKAVVSKQDVRVWLRTSVCPGAPGECLTVGRSVPHQTHVLKWRRGVWWCGLCGGYAISVGGKKNAARKLKDVCRKKRTYAGSCALNRIARGVMPNNQEWPAEDAPPSSGPCSHVLGCLWSHVLSLQVTHVLSRYNVLMNLTWIH